MALITCENVSLAYENNIVLSDLSFAVQAGMYLCIVGENGSGKSTLVKALLSLKRPTQGSIHFGDGLRQNEIGYLPQQTGAQKDFSASVWEVVQSGCINQNGCSPFYSARQKQMAQTNLERMALWDLRRRSYQELSGGQQQRVLLARALCATRKLLLLDEPVAGLDPMAAQEMYRLIQALNREGTTVIMVSHDIQSAVQYASHILHLHNKPLFFGKTADYLQSDVAKRFLGGGLHA
ncbi:MAG: metal ABC transporter ATP-binding protein [Oscillospiraceae bacterium]|nr:metal ABC transporter ATP-binding protein [Oscillospiraceae bacterium]